MPSNFRMIMLVATFFLISAQTRASIITAEAGGAANTFNAGFFSVSFDPTAPSDVFIDSVTFNLAASGNTTAVFDLGNPGTTGIPFQPVLGTVNGVTGISFEPNPVGDPESSYLTINFDPTSFGAGDSLTFGADVDDSGGVSTDNAEFFGDIGTGFSATLSNDVTLASVFATGPSGTTATLDLTTVPEPSSFAMLAVGAVGWFGFRRRRQRNRQLSWSSEQRVFVRTPVFLWP